jgi:hypothetical protein
MVPRKCRAGECSPAHEAYAQSRAKTVGARRESTDRFGFGSKGFGDVETGGFEMRKRRDAGMNQHSKMLDVSEKLANRIDELLHGGLGVISMALAMRLIVVLKQFPAEVRRGRLDRFIEELQAFVKFMDAVSLQGEKQEAARRNETAGEGEVL